MNISNEELHQKVTMTTQKAEIANPLTTKTTLDFNGAVDFLNSVGYPCSTSLIYKKTAKNEIPFTKFRRRMVFCPEELKLWVNSQMTKTVDVDGNVSDNTNKDGGNK
jgi:hypothetical protein